MDTSTADPDPAKIEAQNTQERLFACCERGQREEIAALLAGHRGLFVNCVNWRGETPLHVVRDLSCAELLLENSGGSQTVLNRQNADSETPLMVALRLGDDSLAAFFLDNGADIRPPNKQFQSCLHVAAVSGMVRILDRLLDMRQLDPNQKDRAGNTVLHYAVTYRDVDRATQMLARLLQETQLAVDAPDSTSRTAFILAALSGNLAACRLLRDRGCDLCRADDNGADALHTAAAASQLEAARYLVSDLAFSVNRADKLGRTALFYAVYHNAVEALGQLLALGADPGRMDRLGRTPVHVAAEKGHKACLVCLLEAGADPKMADARCQTPLHLAAAYGHLEVVKRLMRYQNSPGDLDAHDVDGKSARDLAAQGGHQRVQELLTSEAQARELRSGSFPRPKSATAHAKAREREAQKAAAAAAAAESAGKVNEREQESRKETVAEPLLLSHYPSARAEAEASGDSASSHREEAPASASIVSSSVSSLKTDPQQLQQQSESTEQRRQAEAAECCESLGAEAENEPELLSVSHDTPQPVKREESPASTSSFNSASTVSEKEQPRGKDATAAAAAGNNSSRPSSHLEEELHGDPRTREAEDSRDDPYLTAAPVWITGNAPPPPSRAKMPQRPEHQQPQQHQRMLRRSKKVSPNIQALRQRLHMYDSTVMLGRLLSEERRERMLMRGAVPPLPQHLRPRRQTRPSTAASAGASASASASAPGVARHQSRGRRDPDDGGSRETRQLLERWKEFSGSGSGTPRLPQQRQPRSRPQTASRFLDYFPNDLPPESEDKSG